MLFVCLFDTLVDLVTCRRRVRGRDAAGTRAVRLPPSKMIGKAARWSAAAVNRPAVALGMRRRVLLVWRICDTFEFPRQNCSQDKLTRRSSSSRGSKRSLFTQMNMTQGYCYSNPPLEESKTRVAHMFIVPLPTLSAAPRQKVARGLANDFE